MEEVLSNPGEDRPGGRRDHELQLGRSIRTDIFRVIYILDPEPRSVFVITAYELRGKHFNRLSSPQKEKTKMKAELNSTRMGC